jgi:hypothetical protein
MVMDRMSYDYLEGLAQGTDDEKCALAYAVRALVYRAEQRAKECEIDCDAEAAAPVARDGRPSGYTPIPEAGGGPLRLGCSE